MNRDFLFGHQEKDTALGSFRILDLADSKGQYCGKLLADLGADVIKVEKLEGDEARKIPPFKNDIPCVEGSLYFNYYNSNKRSITLDLERKEGQSIFKKLAETADVIIETFQPRKSKEIGLDYSALKKIKKGIILVSITGFGQTGPYKNYLSNEIIAFAMSGAMYEAGSVENPPCLAPGNQTYGMASAYAALGVLIALYYRLTTGLGQQIDISLQASMARFPALTGLHLIGYDIDSRIHERGGQRQKRDPAFGLYPCKDGHVHVGTWTHSQWDLLVEWMGKPEELADPLWRNFMFRNQFHEVVEDLITRFTMSHAKAELYEQGQNRRVIMGPVNTITDFVKNPQIIDRKYFVGLEHSYMGKQTYPGAPYKLSETPWKLERPAPRIGEHNKEIYEELGYSEDEMAQLKESSII